MQGSTDLVQAVARPFVDVDQHHAREAEELYRFGHFPVRYGSRGGRVFRRRIQLGWVPPKPPSELAAGLRVALSGPLWDTTQTSPDQALVASDLGSENRDRDQCRLVRARDVP
jgi:hypothetical protein